MQKLEIRALKYERPGGGGEGNLLHHRKIHSPIPTRREMDSSGFNFCHGNFRGRGKGW